MSSKEARFISACVSGDESEVESCLASGVDVNHEDSVGVTGLVYALYYNRWGLARALLARPSINLPWQDRSDGWTYLHLCCGCGAPADILATVFGRARHHWDTRDKGGITPLEYAVIRNWAGDHGQEGTLG